MHPNVPQCQYIKTNGLRCGSPALRRQRFCYFHYEVNRPTMGIGIPALEDANAIQIALTDVARAVADERLDLKRATVLVYALQTASANLKRVVFGMPSSVTELPEPIFSQENDDAASTDLDSDLATSTDHSDTAHSAAADNPSEGHDFNRAATSDNKSGLQPLRGTNPDLKEIRKNAVRAIRDAAPDILVAHATRKRGS